MKWKVYQTCQWGKRRWDSWHRWICRCRRERSGRSCDSWFCCTSPRGSLRRKVCPLEHSAKNNVQSLHCAQASTSCKESQKSRLKMFCIPVLCVGSMSHISTHPQAFRKGTPPLTTSRTLCRNSHLHLGISVPQVKCSLEFPQLCHIVPYHPEWEQEPNNNSRLCITVKVGTIVSLSPRSTGQFICCGN